MTIKLIFGLVAAVFAIYCFVPYIRDIFLKKTTPHMYSWFLWGLLQIIGAIAIIISGGGYGVLELSIGSLFCFYIFFLSFKYGTKDITRFDTICLFSALFTIIIWIITKDALYAVLLISVIDFMAFVPTYRKGYKEPNSETVSNYFISALASSFAILALSAYSFTNVFYLATLVCTNIVFAFLLLYRRKIVIKL